MGLVLIERDKLTARDCFARCVHIGLSPCKIVGFFGGTFGNALVDKLACRLVNRGEIDVCNVGFEPSFLFRCECDQHVPLYHKAPLSGQAKSWVIPEMTLLFFNSSFNSGWAE
jgi:hypothetical protein